MICHLPLRRFLYIVLSLGVWMFVTATVGIESRTIVASNEPSTSLAPANCRLTRTSAPAFIYDPAINSTYALYKGTVALNTERGVGGTPLHIINLTDQDGAIVSGQTHPVVGMPWEDPAPSRFNPTNAPYNWGNIGSVMGVTLDSWGNIYLAATSSFASTTNPGRIYKVDTVTARVSTFVANVPGDSSGGTSNASLGNISTNIYLNDDVFVVSIDTGVIYRYGTDGVLKSTYDHGTQGRPAVGLESIPNIGSFGNQSATIKGRRVWAAEVYDSGTGPRLYYSVVWRYNGQAPQSSEYTNPPYDRYNININDEDTNNQVWSVALNATTGDFIPATARREFTTVYPGTWQGSDNENQTAHRWPISDIAFVGSSGVMLAATRGAQDNGSNDIVSHEGQVIAATPLGLIWQLRATTFDGFGQVTSRNDGNGGVAWDPTALGGAGRVWITADALWEGPYNGPGPLNQANYNVFGLIGMPDEGASVNQARQNGLLLDVNSNSNQEKQTGGDVEIGCIPEFDYGDLPTTMGNTLLGENGARHLIHLNNNGTPAANQIYLGVELDSEGNGQPSGLANGDDGSGVDDEDGITGDSSTWSQANGGSINAKVAGNGWLVGWIDWNADGAFSDSEMVFSQAVTNGSQQLTFAVPITTFPAGGLYARFRLFTSQTAAQQVGVNAGGTNEAAADVGAAINGEVEDYVFLAPFAVTLEFFEALCQPSQPTPLMMIRWETLQEIGTLGFNLYRQGVSDSERVQLNTELIPAQAPGGGGASYEWLDTTLTDGTYEYWLEDVDMQGYATLHPPTNGTYPCSPTAVILSDIHTSSAIPTWQLCIGVMGVVGLVLLKRK